MRCRLLCSGLCCTVLFGSFAQRGTSAGNPMCSFISFPYIRDGGMTSFLATTLPAALHDTTRRIALTPGRLEPLGTRDPTQAVWGQLVRLQAVRGGMADTLAARLGAGDSAAAVVRWAFDSMCSPVPIHAMLEPGELDYFIGALRPPAAWIEGHPTLDVSPMPNASCGVSIRM